MQIPQLQEIRTVDGVGRIVRILMMVSPVEEIEDVGGYLELPVATQSESFADFEPQGPDGWGLDLTIRAILAHEAIDRGKRIGRPKTVFQPDAWWSILGDIRIVLENVKKLVEIIVSDS